MTVAMSLKNGLVRSIHVIPILPLVPELLGEQAQNITRAEIRKAVKRNLFN
jgi:hypothetical protein